MLFVNATCGSKSRLDGKTVVITGANTGIGKETARDLYYRGARVVIACRNLSKAQQAIEDVKQNRPSKPQREQFAGDPGEIVIYQLNLCSFRSVRECASKIMDNEANIHILINNAGIMMCPYQKTEDGNEYQLQSNHLGHFLFTLLLLPKIKTSGPGCRIINVSALLYLRGDINFEDINLEQSYTPFKGYCQSKLANILFTKMLAEKLKESNIQGITTYTLHPGVISSELGRHVTKSRVMRVINNIGKHFVKNVEQGAQTTIYCAVDETAGKETGLYYKECRPHRLSNKGRNMTNASKLWDISLKMVANDGDNLMDSFKKS